MWLTKRSSGDRRTTLSHLARHILVYLGNPLGKLPRIGNGSRQEGKSSTSWGQDDAFFLQGFVGVMNWASMTSYPGSMRPCRTNNSTRIVALPKQLLAPCLSGSGSHRTPRAGPPSPPRRDEALRKLSTPFTRFLALSKPTSCRYPIPCHFSHSALPQIRDRACSEESRWSSRGSWHLG